MLAESHPFIRRLLRFFALPYCYFSLVNWKECTKTRLQVASDLLYIFFKFKYFPDNYSPCRFWEKDRNEWVYYYSSTYNAYARSNLRVEVQPFEHQVVFNDKSVAEILCKGMSLPIPEGYGVVFPRDDLEAFLQDLFNVSTPKLIIKPVLGHAGQGIVLAEKIDGKIHIKRDGAMIPVSQYSLKETAIVQKVVTQDEEIAKFSSSSLNTIRVVTLLTKSNEVIVLSASMRFGTGTAFVDNWSAGGIAVGVDHKCGTLMSVAYDKHGNQFFEHPESKIRFEGYQLPLWNRTLSIAKKVQQECSFYKLIGVDVALSDSGPVLIEINANPDIIFQEQTAGPFLRDEIILKELSRYNLLLNKYQKALVNG